MNEPLRPSNLGEILDRTAQLYRARFLVFFGIAAVPTALILVVASAVFLFFAWSGDLSNPAVGVVAGMSIAAVALVAVPAYLATTALAAAALNHAAARACFGEKTTIRDAYKAVWPLGWRYIGLNVLQGLIIVGAPIAVWLILIMVVSGVSFLAGRAGAGAVAGLLAGLGLFVVIPALIAYSIWMALRLSLALPACVVEQLSPLPALKRSAALSRGTRGRIFLLYLLGWALNYLLSMVLVFPIMMGAAFLPGANNPQHAQTIAMTMAFAAYGAAFAVQALTKPVYGIALVLFYYDQRIRLEGFDIEWMMLQAGLVVPQSTEKLQAEAGEGFNPRIEPTESTWASAPEAGSPPISAVAPSPSPSNPPSSGDPA